MAAENYYFFNQINTTTEEWAIKVRVQRVWEVFDINTRETKSLDFILSDEHGDQIHGSMAKGIFPELEQCLEEGKTYHLENFTVEEKMRKYYCPVKHRYSIGFKDTTIMHWLEEDDTFPEPKYEFVPFNKLSTMAGHNDYLTDVIGVFNELKDVEILKGGKKKRDLIIDNKSGDSVKITFWGEDMKKIPFGLDNNGERRILVIFSTIVKQFRDEYYLQSTFGIKVIVDMEIVQAEELKPCVTKEKAKYDKTWKRERSLSEPELKTIQEIKAIRHKKSQGLYNCIATITDLYEHKGWYYNSCPKCWKKAYPKKTNYFCFKCKEDIEVPDSKYQLEFKLKDDTSDINVTAFSTEAENLIGCSIDTMIDLALKDEGNVLVSTRLNKVIGKRAKFLLKINERNVYNPKENLTVAKISQAEFRGQDGDDAKDNKEDTGNKKQKSI